MSYLKIIIYVLSAIALGLLNFVEGNLTITPVDIEVLSGRSAYFNCSTSINNTHIRWYFYPVGSSERKTIYTKGKLTELYVDRFHIENSSEGVFNLVILSVTLGDAGRYVCQDDEGYGDSASAEQIVLDGDPVCNSPETKTGFIGDNSCGLQPDIIQLSCRIKYQGNRHPMAKWRKSGDENPISVGVNYTKNSSYVEYMLTMNADISLNNNSYFCEIGHSGINRYRCGNAVIINILYAMDINSAVVNKTKGDEITCSANSNVPCKYKWKKIENGNELIVSNYNILRPEYSEKYNCEAECSFFTNMCTFTVMTVQVFSAEASSGHGMMALLVLLLVAVIVVVIIVIILLKRRRRMNARKSTTSSQFDQEAQTRHFEIQSTPSPGHKDWRTSFGMVKEEFEHEIIKSPLTQGTSNEQPQSETEKDTNEPREGRRKHGTLSRLSSATITRNWTGYKSRRKSNKS